MRRNRGTRVGQRLGAVARHAIACVARVSGSALSSIARFPWRTVITGAPVILLPRTFERAQPPREGDGAVLAGHCNMPALLKYDVERRRWCSLHVPLAFGRLTFKSESRLRQREKDGRATLWAFRFPVRRLGGSVEKCRARRQRFNGDQNVA